MHFWPPQNSSPLLLSLLETKGVLLACFHLQLPDAGLQPPPLSCPHLQLSEELGCVPEGVQLAGVRLQLPDTGTLAPLPSLILTCSWVKSWAVCLRVSSWLVSASSSLIRESSAATPALLSACPLCRRISVNFWNKKYELNSEQQIRTKIKDPVPDPTCSTMSPECKQILQQKCYQRFII